MNEELKKANWVASHQHRAENTQDKTNSKALDTGAPAQGGGITHGLQQSQLQF